MKKLLTYTLFVTLAFAGNSLFAQGDKQAELEQKRKAIEEEIRQINTLIFSTRKKEKTVLEEVEDISQRIRVRENLIKATNEQANFLTREINNNQRKIDDLRSELEQLKDDYAAMIEKSYKSKSEQSRVMFLLSSENFLQAYKRAQYLKQYTKFRKEQGLQIQEKTIELQELNKMLVVQQREKQKLLEENKAVRAQLQKEKLQQEALMATLKKDENKYVNQVKAKQREAAKIDKEIDRLIKEAIAEANRKAAAERGAAPATGGSTTTFAMTAEAKALAANFTSNKGKLPWPVEKGVVITKFGVTQHPTLPNVKTSSSGVEIVTETGTDARASFDGEVIAVAAVKGIVKAVYVRHGDFITIYQNLDEVYVKKGDKVKTKQALGKVYYNPSSEKAVLKFYVFQNDKKLNPAEWVYQMK